MYPVKPAKINQQEFSDRVASLQASMRSVEVDAVLLVAGSNMRYLTGLNWQLTERLVGALITQSNTIYICPKFEESAMRAAVRVEHDFAFWQEHESPTDLVANLLKAKNLTSLAIDANSPFWLVERLQKSCHDLLITSATGLVGDLRACKSENELALIRYAMQLTLKVQQQAFEFIRPGMRTSEISKFIDETHRKLGADNGSYFCAVQFNEGTSHPHGVPGDPQLTDNSLILIDTGCQVDGYHSDITRTYCIGKVPQKIHDIWHIEKEAQQAAFDAAKPGVPCENVDYAARQVLHKHGLSADYELPGLPHRTGHGLGLEIHEAPYLVRGDKTPLAKGMCFSNEPMIVVPNEFGVRLEDHFYMDDDAAQWFTQPQHSIERPFG